MAGLFKAPRSGDYIFYIASDDDTRVWLSTDATAANKGVTPLIDWTGSNAYRHHMLYYGTTRSVARTLVAGNYYFLEVYHAEGNGDDHFSLGVEVPHGGGTYDNKLFEV